jgi:hypothetical protein
MTLLLIFAAAIALGAAPVLDGASHHLGTPGKPEWEEFTGSRAEGRTLTVLFAGKSNAQEATLRISQRGVKLNWSVRLNGRVLGQLVPMEEPLVLALPVPAGSIRDGENALTIGLAAGDDDIIVARVELESRPLAEALGEATLDVHVSDAGSHVPIPCRITVVNERGELAPLRAPPEEGLAVRPGVAYTGRGRARLGVGAGHYTVYASRGFEYGLARTDVALAPGDTAAVALAIAREVPTPGLVACDTHVHTLTHSGHGDATIAERVVTLAGEAVELPIATDHNHLTDLRPFAEKAGVSAYFTPVIGDEVTTRRGHFNALPFRHDETAPGFQADDWGVLIRCIRGDSSQRVVILNHPRDLHSNFRPFDPAWFHALAGAPRGGGRFDFDAVEVLNSGAMQSDPFLLFHDWFALWNHGTPVTAVGSSDSHDVSRFIVGQARTYIACGDSDPGRIDIAAACRSLRGGRALVSFGLLVNLAVDDRYHVGDLATGLGPRVRVGAEVFGPSWTQADQISLFANGVLIRQQPIEPSAVAGLKARFEWEIDRPAGDAALVAIASGPGVTAPHCATPRPYQPTSRAWRPRVVGATNPIRLDGDGDGVFSSPRAQAAAIIAATGADPGRLIAGLAAGDEAVAVQAADLCRASGRDIRSEAFRQRLATASETVRRGFAAYADTLETP